MRRLIFSFLVLSLVVPSFLVAQNRSAQQRRNTQNQNLKSEISILDENQKKDWQKIRIDFQKQKNELKAKLQNANLDLRQLMNEQREPNENAVNNKLDEIANYKNKLAKLSHEQQMKFRKLISDEQWQQIQELKKKRFAMKKRNQLNKRNFRNRPKRKL